MNVISLEVENVKKITAVAIKPDGSLVVISGNNGAGKSSLIDSIFWALTGKGSVDKEPIRKGQESASIKLDLGEFIVTRKFTKTGTSLVVTTPDGTKYSSPQSVLNDLIGPISYDPLEFSGFTPAQQVRMLSEIAKVDVDYDKVDKLNAEDYEERTVINRQVKELSSQIAGRKEAIGEIPEDAKPMIVMELLEEIAEAQEEANRKQSAEAAYERALFAQKAREDKVKELEEQLKNEKHLLVSSVKEARRLKEALDEITVPPEEEIAALKENLMKASAYNDSIKERDSIIEDEKRLDGLESESRKLTRMIENRNKEAQAKVESAKMPLDKLSMTREGIIYDGIPYEQINDAEKLKINTSIAIALNPKLKIILIKRGNDLDKNGLKFLGEIAEENGFQVWVEHINKEPMSFHIVDGSLEPQ